MRVSINLESSSFLLPLTRLVHESRKIKGDKFLKIEKWDRNAEELLFILKL